MFRLGGLVAFLCLASYAAVLDADSVCEVSIDPEPVVNSFSWNDESLSYVGDEATYLVVIEFKNQRSIRAGFDNPFFRNLHNPNNSFNATLISERALRFNRNHTSLKVRKAIDSGRFSFSRLNAEDFFSLNVQGLDDFKTYQVGFEISQFQAETNPQYYDVQGGDTYRVKLGFWCEG